MTDGPVHLPKTNSKTDPYAEASITVPVWITQSDLDGLWSLILWLEGYNRASPALISGHHELIMLYRKLRDVVFKALKPKEEAPNPKEKEEGLGYHPGALDEVKTW